MKLHCCVINSNDDGTLLSWHGSKRAAQRHARELIEEQGDESGLTLMNIEQYDIPTDKAGLINWLNTHFTTDNG